MPNTGLLTPSFLFDDGDTTEYTNPQNARVADGSFATCTLVAASNAEGLYCNQYGAAIPSNATIVGVEFHLRGLASVAGTADGICGLLNVGGSGVRSTTFLGTSNGYVIAGGSTDTWDVSITPAQVNDTAFGVFCYVENDLACNLSVDACQIIVYYTLPSKLFSLLGVGR